MLTATYWDLNGTCGVVVGVENETAINHQGSENIEYLQTIVYLVLLKVLRKPRGERFLSVLCVLEIFFLFNLPFCVSFLRHLKQRCLIIHDQCHFQIQLRYLLRPIN